jgi:hypothetical protein
MTTYKLDLWRRLKKSGKDSGNLLARLGDIRADAEMDKDIVLGCWNGERFVSWAKWVAAVPRGQAPDSEPPADEPDTDCVHTACDSTPEERTQSPAKTHRHADPAQEQLSLLDAEGRLGRGIDG